MGWHSEKQPESDSALSATSDESDIELNGETDEDMEERRDSMVGVRR